MNRLTKHLTELDGGRRYQGTPAALLEAIASDVLRHFQDIAHPGLLVVDLPEAVTCENCECLLAHETAFVGGGDDDYLYFCADCLDTIKREEEQNAQGAEG